MAKVVFFPGRTLIVFNRKYMPKIENIIASNKVIIKKELTSIIGANSRVKRSLINLFQIIKLRITKLKKALKNNSAFILIINNDLTHSGISL